MSPRAEVESRSAISPTRGILGLGAVAVDDLVYVDAYPHPDAKVRVLDTARHCGGLTATALVAASRLGVPCSYAGVLGTDDFSAFAALQMEREGINLTHVQRHSSAAIYHSYIVVGAQENSRTIFSDGRNVIGAADHWPPLEVIESCGVLFVDHVGIPGMLRAARIASAAGIPIVSDLERVSGAGFEELLPLIDHFIVSQDFAAELTGETSPEAAVRRLAVGARGVVAVTAGARGCWYTSPGEAKPVAHQPAYPVKVVDTTGCGDVFHGAYAAGLAMGLEVHERFRVAAAAAALKATQPGGQAGAPSWAHVQEFLKSQPSAG
jgi:ribokinase